MKRSKKKLLIILTTAILTVCLIYTTIWFINYDSYNKFIGDSLTKLPYSSNSFVDRTSPIIYGVKKPAFLSFTGNLTCVGKNGVITILIWPSFISKKTDKIGIIIADDENKTSYMVYVDKNMNYNKKLNEEIGYTKEEAYEMKKLINSYKDDISELYTLAKEKFNL
ncbi:MAG: hypothetical protein U0K54_05705 [Acutalibacteraceae bacterium]|nr:hypothetical protein [Acutalibacteraceae bacterium]